MDTLHFRTFTDEELQTLTGKSWGQWCDLIDAWDTEIKNFTTISAYLMRYYCLRRLWAQMIAVYYKTNWCSPRAYVQ
jgi:hypothetical protein